MLGPEMTASRAKRAPGRDRPASTESCMPLSCRRPLEAHWLYHIPAGKMTRTCKVGLRLRPYYKHERPVLIRVQRFAWCRTYRKFLTVIHMHMQVCTTAA